MINIRPIKKSHLILRDATMLAFFSLLVIVHPVMESITTSIIARPSMIKLTRSLSLVRSAHFALGFLAPLLSLVPSKLSSCKLGRGVVWLTRLVDIGARHRATLYAIKTRENLKVLFANWTRFWNFHLNIITGTVKLT